MFEFFLHVLASTGYEGWLLPPELTDMTLTMYSVWGWRSTTVPGEPLTVVSKKKSPDSALKM